jgi:hypothetical protein
MKSIFNILAILLLFTSCKNAVTKTAEPSPTPKAINIDTVAHQEPHEIKRDTIKNVSKPFMLNNLMCYWEHFFVIYNYGGLEITMKLYDNKTKKILLEYEYQPKYEEDYDYKSATYFDSINKRHFDDFNFDGFKDFTLYEYGSMPMTSTTVIMLFNNETKTFEPSELSAPVIDEIDSFNKILTTHEWNMENVYYKKYHFYKNGKIKFKEEITERDYYPNDTTQKLIRISKKIINNKEVETKIDTIAE